MTAITDISRRAPPTYTVLGYTPPALTWHGSTVNECRVSSQQGIRTAHTDEGKAMGAPTEYMLRNDIPDTLSTLQSLEQSGNAYLNFCSDKFS